MQRIEYYQETNGKCPVLDFIDDIKNIKLQTKVMRDVGLLDKYGETLREP